MMVGACLPPLSLLNDSSNIMKKKFLNSLAALLLASVYFSSASANVTIIGTRVIYPSSEKEVTVRLDNRGNQPALVQAWIDDGDINQAVDKINVPFVLLPPVFRMEANKGQTLRIVFTGSNLPADKESIYWLNVLDIPPKDKSLADKNQLQMAIRSRIKLFYRPTGLNSRDADKSAAALIWRKNNKTNRLTAVNNSPYHINVAQITAETADGRKVLSENGGMLLPHGTKDFTFKTSNIDNIKPTLHYQYLDDFGAARDVESQLSQ